MLDLGGAAGPRPGALGPPRGAATLRSKKVQLHRVVQHELLQALHICVGCRAHQQALAAARHLRARAPGSPRGSPGAGTPRARAGSRLAPLIGVQRRAAPCPDLVPAAEGRTKVPDISAIQGCTRRQGARARQGAQQPAVPPAPCTAAPGACGRGAAAPAARARRGPRRSRAWPA